MKNFVVFSENGRILRAGTCQDVDFSLQATDREGIIEALSITDFEYVENGQLVPMPNKPEGEWVFDYDSKSWVFDSVAADAKAKSKRDFLLRAGPDRINPIWWSTMSDSEKLAWTKYRQELLDITNQPDYPATISWPEKPN